MDHYASTATSNDSFIGGVAGAGYVYLGDLTELQLQRYATRVGQLYKKYGPTVADTYGSANLSTIAKYSRYAAQGGLAPAAYVASAPRPFGAQSNTTCPELNVFSPADGTPIICTAHSPSLFYRNRHISQTDPAKDLAHRIRTVASRYKPPFFVTVYGGLKWTASDMSPKTEFFTLMHGTMDDLGTGFEAIGASEMARLSKLACQAHTHNTTSNTTATCGISSVQVDCSPLPPGTPWKNSSEDVCVNELGCCWHHGGIKPSRHWCIKKEAARIRAPSAVSRPPRYRTPHPRSCEKVGTGIATDRHGSCNAIPAATSARSAVKAARSCEED
jgi:hypothetical protein